MKADRRYDFAPFDSCYHLLVTESQYGQVQSSLKRSAS